MKKQFLTGALAVGTLLTGTAVQSEAAHAAILSCPSSIQDLVKPLDSKVSTNFGCQIFSGSNNDSQERVNSEGGFFSRTDWVFAGKDDNGGTLEDLIGRNLDGTDSFIPGSSTEGNWNIASLFEGVSPVIPNDWTDIMLVLKGSGRLEAGGSTDNFVGYLLSQVGPDGILGTADDWTGTWETPYVNNNGNPQEISHISLYYRNGGEPIPTPALLPGLVGIGVAAIRKKKNEAASEEA